MSINFIEQKDQNTLSKLYKTAKFFLASEHIHAGNLTSGSIFRHTHTTRRI